MAGKKSSSQPAASNVSARSTAQPSAEAQIPDRRRAARNQITVMRHCTGTKMRSMKTSND